VRIEDFLFEFPPEYGLDLESRERFAKTMVVLTFLVFALIGILFLTSEKVFLANMLSFFSCLLIGMLVSGILYFAARDTEGLQNALEFVRALDADAWACYSPFPLSYVSAEKNGITATIKSRTVYLCRGAEENASLMHKFRLATGRNARVEMCSESLSLGDFRIGVSEMAEIILPHPRKEGKVMRGKGFRITISGPFHWKLDSVIIANLVWNLSREV